VPGAGTEDHLFGPAEVRRSILSARSFAPAPICSQHSPDAGAPPPKPAETQVSKLLDHSKPLLMTTRVGSGESSKGEAPVLMVQARALGPCGESLAAAHSGLEILSWMPLSPNISLFKILVAVEYQSTEIVRERKAWANSGGMKTGPMATFGGSPIADTAGRCGLFPRSRAAPSEGRRRQRAHFLVFYAPGEFKTIWTDPSKASAWISANRIFTRSRRRRAAESIAAPQGQAPWRS
jgi:hypothetical protein